MSNEPSWRRQPKLFDNAVYQILGRPVMLEVKGDDYIDDDMAVYDVRVMWEDWIYADDIMLNHDESDSEIVWQLKPIVQRFLDRYRIDPETIEVSMGGMRAKVFWVDDGSENLYSIVISDAEGEDVEDFYHDFINDMPYSETEDYVRNELADYLSVHKSFNDRVKSIRYNISKDARSEMFEGKKRYAERRNLENSKIDTLSEEQHDALAWLCKIRHDMHVSKDSFFLSESADHEKYWGYVDNGISDRLRSVNLPPFDFIFDEADYVTDSTYEVDGLDYESAYLQTMEYVEGFNRYIESYLRDIDSMHGTQYAPTGYSRIY